MLFSNLFSKNSAILGIDIGTAYIKIAQISHNPNPLLDTYGIVNISNQLGAREDENAVQQTSQILKTLLSKSGVTTKRCVISFPNSAVFTSVIQLPKMSEKEMVPAVEFEARKYVPLALSEIDLSWTVIQEAVKETEGVKVLLTAVPKQVTKNYMKVFHLAGLEPEVGEIEALALIRSLIGNNNTNCVIIDIGSRSTGLTIIENGFLRLSRNLNIGGDTITSKIAGSLNITTFRAEQFKKDFGVSSSTFIPDVIKPILNVIKNEVKQLLTIYQSQNVKVDKILLVGGGSNLPGIVEYFGDLKVNVELGNPLQAIAYKKNLEPILKRYALSLPVAVGLALRKE
jgi:type IV pilus assembly protein PilM